MIFSAACSVLKLTIESPSKKSEGILSLPSISLLSLNLPKSFTGINSRAKLSKEELRNPRRKSFRPFKTTLLKPRA